jgi:hypothetical protein
MVAMAARAAAAERRAEERATLQFVKNLVSRLKEQKYAEAAELFISRMEWWRRALLVVTVVTYIPTILMLVRVAAQVVFVAHAYAHDPDAFAKLASAYIARVVSRFEVSLLGAYFGALLALRFLLNLAKSSLDALDDISFLGFLALILHGSLKLVLILLNPWRAMRAARVCFDRVKTCVWAYNTYKALERHARPILKELKRRARAARSLCNGCLGNDDQPLLTTAVDEAATDAPAVAGAPAAAPAADDGCGEPVAAAPAAEKELLFWSGGLWLPHALLILIYVRMSAEPATAPLAALVALLAAVVSAGLSITLAYVFLSLRGLANALEHTGPGRLWRNIRCLFNTLLRATKKFGEMLGDALRRLGRLFTDSVIPGLGRALIYVRDFFTDKVAPTILSGLSLGEGLVTSLKAIGAQIANWFTGNGGSHSSPSSAGRTPHDAGVNSGSSGLIPDETRTLPRRTKLESISEVAPSVAAMPSSAVPPLHMAPAHRVEAAQVHRDEARPNINSAGRETRNAAHHDRARNGQNAQTRGNNMFGRTPPPRNYNC